MNVSINEIKYPDLNAMVDAEPLNVDAKEVEKYRNQLIKNGLKKRNLTIKKTAKMIGVSRTHLSLILNGKSNMSIFVARNLKEILKIDKIFVIYKNTKINL
jgi:predicted transcriptional regulator